MLEKSWSILLYIRTDKVKICLNKNKRNYFEDMGYS